MTKINELLAMLGIVSIETEVRSGTQKIENLLNSIQKTKDTLTGLVAGAVVSKQVKISKKNIEIEMLETEIEGLKDMEKAIENLG